MTDPRGFDLCVNIDDMDDATLARPAESGTLNPDIKSIVCCRVKGGVVVGMFARGTAKRKPRAESPLGEWSDPTVTVEGEMRAVRRHPLAFTV
jgi:hypothetical protein|mmetsp:Transcript_6962/g.10854  ORF Transcript_6962/g.10854 Transcript_6962/m.10854 type:complete len:93 (-) Transcript_6962:912-1190(-)